MSIDVAVCVSVVPIEVMEMSVVTTVSTAVVVFTVSTVLVSYLTEVASLYLVTKTVEVGLRTVAHVVVGFAHAFVVVR